MRELVRLNLRPSSDGKSFVYVLRYVDENGKRRWQSLGHADKRKAERQRIELERQLHSGAMEPGSMRLSEFLEDSLTRTGSQIRESTIRECRSAMTEFVKILGNMDLARVSHKDGEKFVRVCLDNGNAPATVGKKLRHLKRLLQLAVDRGQLDTNPMRRVKAPKSPRRKVHVYKSDECDRILGAARSCLSETPVRWDLLTLMALETAMRRGELLNATWKDIDFAARTIEVAPKDDSDETWEWQIKDTDRRTLPLTDEIVSLLIQHQEEQPEGYPYVFVPVARYDHIQKLRKQGKWTYSDSRLKVINNFGRQFGKILKRAGVAKGEFHDLRRTALTNWLAKGMSEHEVMVLAGHANFATTHKFYLAVADDLVDRARQVTAACVSRDLVQNWCSDDSAPKSKKDRQSQVIVSP